MTTIKEIETLQSDARRANRIANLCFSEGGKLDGVFYLDPKGKGREKSGMIIDVLTFSEKERQKKKWWEI